MKRNALLKHLRTHGCFLKREGGSHSLWMNPITGAAEAVPRHNEIKNILDTFSDRDLIRHAIQKRNPATSRKTVEDFLDKIEDYFQSDEGQKLIVRYAVAEVVESVFGANERGEYLLAVIEGKAN